MVGLGTVINTAAILAGGVCGAFFGRVLSQGAQDTLMKVCGVGTLFIAISGAMEGMLTVQDGKIFSSGDADYRVPCHRRCDRGSAEH